MTLQPTTKRELSRWSILAYWLLSNGPAIITVLGSASIALLASVINFTQVQFFQAILSLIALIGTSLATEKLLEGRHIHNRLDNISSHLDQVLEYAQDIENASMDRLVISRRDLPPLETRLMGAKRIAISGGSLFRLVNEYKKLFEQLAENGCQIRFVMTDPEAHAAEYLSAVVSYESNSVNAYRTLMRDALAGLKILSQHYPQNCLFKLCTFAPPFSLVMADRDVGKSTIQVELYPFAIPTRDRPIFLICEDRDPRLFKFFSSQFETLWTHSFTNEETNKRVEPVEVAKLVFESQTPGRTVADKSKNDHKII